MSAKLPAPLANDGKANTLIGVMVADDVDADTNRIELITILLLLSDTAAEALPEAQRLEQVITAKSARRTPDSCARNSPLAKGIEEYIERPMNKACLDRANVGDG